MVLLDSKTQPVLAVLWVISLFQIPFALSQSRDGESEDRDTTGTEPSVQAMLEDEVTAKLHDDTTLLRNVTVLKDETGLVFFDALRIWVGGAVQYDYYNFDGIFHHTGDGEHIEGGNVRRLEGILRSSLYDWGEIKAQYDFDSGVFRDLYLRWVSRDSNIPWIVTIGNQKEPRSLDQLLGNKSTMAQERSAPAYAFGTERSLGVRLHNMSAICHPGSRFYGQ